ncbi:hypothetical protein SAMN05660206_1134 [Sphingobacterium wenxiniae]|uniref:Uncharacterized protein n=2 Tax=Sphingobacterium wenxiniae TaxID=683125 RepID=A0A1I6VDB2_9SPHI|nr:hypothetical protein SAMN05660206_1134 [Sphingobacterium wenxiniae]
MSVIKSIILIFFLSFHSALIAKNCSEGYAIAYTQDSITIKSPSINKPTSNLIKELEIKPVYSNSSFNWSIAGNNNAPNVLSELNWRDIRSYGVNIDMGLCFNDVAKPYLSFAVEKNYKGIGTDVDYSDDNRQTIVYNRAFESDKGHYMKLSLLHPITKRGNLLVGLTSSFQRLNLFHEDVGKNSMYAATWFGVEGKLWNSVYNEKRFAIAVNNSVRLSRYLGKAKWLMREDLRQPVSFKHYTFMGELESSIKLFLSILPTNYRSANFLKFCG